VIHHRYPYMDPDRWLVEDSRTRHRRVSFARMGRRRLHSLAELAANPFNPNEVSFEEVEEVEVRDCFGCDACGSHWFTRWRPPMGMLEPEWERGHDLGCPFRVTR